MCVYTEAFANDGIFPSLMLGNCHVQLFSHKTSQFQLLCDHIVHGSVLLNPGYHARNTALEISYHCVLLHMPLGCHALILFLVSFQRVGEVGGIEI